jgi:alkanesulfonate monooxygenase SsuD/methylene tetrahydromethanopterin reductase-like flavin-dependent oxidoreductase (luciferase family)
VVRGPAQLAKALSALDVLSGGRVVAGVGPGSSPADYALAGIPFEDRWRRFDDALRALRGLLEGDELAPRGARPDGVPVWVASWGSAAGLRRAARLGDGWIASAYNVTPERFRECRVALRQFTGFGQHLPNALATTWTYVSESPADAERVLTGLLAPMLRRPVESLRHLPVGPPEVCAERLAAFADAGVDRVLLWPVADVVRQLELLRERVFPAVPDGVAAQPRSSPG